MRKIIFLVFLLFLMTHLVAQITVNIVVNPPFSPYFEDYLEFDNKVVILLQNQSATERSIYLHGSLSSDNGIDVVTKENAKPSSPYLVPPHGVLRLIGGDLEGVFSFEDINFTGITKKELLAASGLPEGNYKICLQAFDWDTDQPVSPESPLGCSAPFSIEHIHPAEIITPSCGTEVTVTDPQNVLFSWTITPGALPGTEYLLQITEVLEGQSPEEAMDALIDPPLFEKQISGNSYVYSVSDPPFVQGQQYAIRVQSIDPMGEKLYRNNGFSEVCSFTYGKKEEFHAYVTMPQGFERFTHCSCNNPPSGNLKRNYTINKGDIITMDDFSIRVDEVMIPPSAPNWKFSGSGSVSLPWLGKHIRIKIDFTQIQLNNNNEVIHGSARGALASNASFLPYPDVPQVHTAPLDASKASALDQYFIQNKDKLLSQANQGGLSFELPIGLDEGVGDQLIAITGLYLTPENAAIDAAIAFGLPGENPDVIALSGSGICISQAGLCGEAKLYLSQDLTLPSGITLIKSDYRDKGTYVTMQNGGFKNMHLTAQYNLPTKLVQKDKGSGAVSATFSTTLTDWSDWTAEVTIDAFKIFDVDDFVFKPQKGVYDHSDLSNPNNLPASYQNANGNPYWRGLFFKEIKVDLPPFIGVNNVSSQDLILDNHGVTTDLEASNILDMNSGSLSGWPFSINHFFAHIMTNSLTTAGFDGNLKLPISETEFNYIGALDLNAGKYNLAVTMKDDLNVPMWLAKFTLDQTSTIQVAYTSSQGVQAEANLNGKMNITEKLDNPPIDLSFTLMSFEGLHLKTAEPYLFVDDFHAGLSSPPKFLSGLPVSLTNIGLNSMEGTQVGLQFTVGLSLLGDESDKNVLNASTTLTLKSKINPSLKHPKWTYEGIDLDSISLTGDIGPLGLEGTLKFFNSPKLGKGVSGSLKMEVADMFGVDANAMFGSKNGNSFWYVDAMATITPAIQLGSTPFQLKGFGGGAYYNLARNPLPEDPMKLKRSDDPSENFRYSPSTIGFKAAVLIGIEEGVLLNIKGTLSMEFGSGFSKLKKIIIDADAGLITERWSITDALATGESTTEIDFVNKVFQSKNNMKMSVGDFVEANSTVDIMFSWNSGAWHVFMGLPPEDRRTKISLHLGKFAKLDASSYFCTGTDISTDLPPIKVPNYPKKSKTTRNKGGGLSLGAGFHASLDETFAIFYIKAYAGLGFDILLSNNIKCEGYSSSGINGWYAQGQAYIYAGIDFGLDVDVWLYEGRVSAGKIDVAAILKAQLPNPTWLGGTFYAHYSVLDGLVSGSVNYEFSVGEKCKIIEEPFNPFAALPIVDEVRPHNQQQKTDIMIVPVSTFNYPMEKKITVKDEEGKRHDFYIKMDQFSLYKKGRKVFSKAKRKWSMDKRATELDFDMALEPHTTYTLVVKVSAWRYKNGKKIKLIYKGKQVKEKKRIGFKTGDCVSDLAGNILYTYPIEGQRHFLPGESNEGFILLKKGIGCLTKERGYKYYASFQNRDFLPGIQLTPIKTKGNKLTFEIPPLSKSTKYRMVLLKRKIRKKPKGSGLTSKPKYTKGIYKTNENWVQWSKVKVETNPIKPGDVVLYESFFQTSAYHTFAQKMAALQPPRFISVSYGHKSTKGNNTKKAFHFFGMYINKYYTPEGFDETEANGAILFKGSARNFRPDYYVFPLVRTWLKTEGNTYAYWLSKVYKRASDVYGDARPPRTAEENMKYGLYPPTRPVFIDDVEPKMNGWEFIFNGTNPAILKDHFQIAYGVPITVYNDWWKIEANARTNYIMDLAYPWLGNKTKKSPHNYYFFTHYYKYYRTPIQFKNKGAWRMNLEYRVPEARRATEKGIYEAFQDYTQSKITKPFIIK